MQKAIVFLLSMICITSQLWAQSDLHVALEDLNQSILFTKIQNFEPAKPIVSVQVVSVLSTPFPNGESIQKNQIGTNYHHYGPMLQVITFEIGDGIEPYATLNNSDLTLRNQIQTLAICEKTNGQLEDCANGGIFYGRLRLWNASDFGIGVFKFQIRSSPFPNRAPLSTILRIN